MEDSSLLLLGRGVAGEVGVSAAAWWLAMFAGVWTRVAQLHAQFQGCPLLYSIPKMSRCCKPVALVGTAYHASAVKHKHGVEPADNTQRAHNQHICVYYRKNKKNCDRAPYKRWMTADKVADTLNCLDPSKYPPLCCEVPTFMGL